MNVIQKKVLIAVFYALSMVYPEKDKKRFDTFSAFEKVLGLLTRIIGGVSKKNQRSRKIGLRKFFEVYKTEKLDFGGDCGLTICHCCNGDRHMLALHVCTTRQEENYPKWYDFDTFYFPIGVCDGLCRQGEVWSKSNFFGQGFFCYYPVDYPEDTEE